MTNKVVLNAEFDLHPNQNDKKLWSNYERNYGRLNFNADFQAKRRGQVKSNRHQAQIIFNQPKINNYFTLLLNIFSQNNLNSFI